ncbi:MAG: hypothetical protein ACRC33_11325 [Gemmataceae bacterium]
MRHVFRPAVLIGLSLLLVAAAAFVVLSPAAGQGTPQPLPVPSGTHEVAWLHPATSGTTWERLVMAMKRAAERLAGERPGLEVIEAGSPAEAVPEVTLRWDGGAIVFRWYKLTSAWTAQAWAARLLARDPPPLAVISGSTTNWAREVAGQLQAHADRVPPERRPLLLLTTATAYSRDAEAYDDQPEPDDEARTLEGIYPGRTFRFCFTNRQMAQAVTRFVWSQPDLQPDRGPVFTVQWEDDAYSRDLFLAYQREVERREADGVWQLARLALRPLGTDPLVWGAVPAGFRQEAAVPMRIESGVGGYFAPNTYEARAVTVLLQSAAGMRMAGTMPARPLLVVTGQVGPTRRFLRDLARSSPALARRFIVASGDAISFDNVYRDRRVTWPIQDLPFVLVFFCHRNPVDARAGFVRDGDPGGGPRQAGGTEMVRLYEDIVEALALAAPGCGTADDLRAGLFRVRFVKGRLTLDAGGVPLFCPAGRRNDRTGEHVVCVRPLSVEDRSLPESLIEVWRRNQEEAWVPAAEPIRAEYHEQERADDRQ